MADENAGAGEGATQETPKQEAQPPIPPLPGSPDYVKWVDRQDAERRARKAKPKAKAKEEAPAPEVVDKGKQEHPGTQQAEAEEKAKASEQAIPKGRFDEVLKNNRALKSEIDQLKGRLEQLAAGQKQATAEPEPRFDFGKARAARIKAAKDGEWERFEQLDTLISDEREKEIQKRIDSTADEVSTDASRNAQVQVAVGRVLAKYPELDRDHEAHNADALAFISKHASFAMSAAADDPSMNVSAELEDIASAAAAKFGLGGGAQGGGEVSAEQQLIEALGGKKSAAEIAQQLAADKAKQAQGQPPNVSRLGEGGEDAKARKTVSDIISMSDQDLQSMPADEKAALRGDFLEDAA